jgi:hypothetical protein
VRLFRRRSPDPPDPLGSGVWRRTYDDCATAARRSGPRLDPGSARRLSLALAVVLDTARTAGERWPTDALDVPADPAARLTYERLRGADRAFREVAYRVSLLAAGTGGGGGVDQVVLLARALDDLEAVVAGLGQPQSPP